VLGVLLCRIVTGLAALPQEPKHIS